MNTRLHRIAVFGLVLLAAAVAGWAQAKSVVDTGVEFYKAGKYNEAIEVFRQVLRTSLADREIFTAYLYLGYTYFALQQMDDAKAQVGKAVEIDPNFVPSEPDFIAEFVAFYKKTKEEIVGIGFFDSLPPNAKFSLDGKPLGVTPMKKELLAGTYLLRMVRPGYEPYEMLVDIKKSEIGNFKIDLTGEKNWKTFFRSSLIFVALAVLALSL
jgi:tetratricopeptide (TPR) repeat protein